jgi:hypothetical protein
MLQIKERISVADPGCLSRIPDPNCLHPGSDLFPTRIRMLTLPIPDPGVKKAPDPESRIRIRNTGANMKLDQK